MTSRWTRQWAALAGAVIALAASGVRADGIGSGSTQDCRGGNDSRPAVSFIQFSAPNLAAPGQLLTIKGKLALPPGCGQGRRVPAVLILHGSSGVDARGDFHEAALNHAGIATLQIDMWEARGVTGVANRPAAPILTYPDAFAALAFLAQQPRIDAERIGVLGFSWGGVISLASAERLYAGLFGGGRSFKAHVAHYPVCYAANNTAIPALQPPAQKGTQFLNLTGAPVLIQVGSEDDYDNGTAHCQALAAQVNPANGNVVKVEAIDGAFHAWDRLMVPVGGPDPFGNEGSFFSTGVLPIVQLKPDVAKAYESRERAVRFFKRHL